MKRLSIYMADGTYGGTVILSSPVSRFKAVRVRKEEISQCSSDLNLPGVYMLLINDDTVYVGESGLDTVGKRALNTHSGNIDASWHTLIGFCCNDSTISKNELQFIENALCEYVHQHYANCATTNPAKNNCNAQYRNQHYHLGTSQIQTCRQYVDEIQDYISYFTPSIFGSVSSSTGIPEKFYYTNRTRDSYGIAEILIHCGHKRQRKAVLKTGSKISMEVSSAFSGWEKVVADRDMYTQSGKIVNRILQEDIEFPSQSGAGQFLNGTSFNGNDNWKTNDGTKLKYLLI